MAEEWRVQQSICRWHLPSDHEQEQDQLIFGQNNADDLGTNVVISKNSIGLRKGNVGAGIGFENGRNELFSYVDLRDQND